MVRTEAALQPLLPGITFFPIFSFTNKISLFKVKNPELSDSFEYQMKKARPKFDITVETKFGTLQDSWNLITIFGLYYRIIVM